MKHVIVYILFFCSVSAFSQEKLSALLDLFNNESIPYIAVNELAMPKTNAVILDAREFAEYEVSHIKDALFVGYSNFNIDSVKLKIEDLDQQVVVYCTLGVRSEDIAEKLKEAGYTNVYNLYGGIVEWKNKDFTVYNSEENETDNVHVCNTYWSQWLLKGNKVFNDR